MGSGVVITVELEGCKRDSGGLFLIVPLLMTVCSRVDRVGCRLFLILTVAFVYDFWSQVLESAEWGVKIF